MLMIFQFFCSPFFQGNCYFHYQCTTHDIPAHRPIFAHAVAAAAACMNTLQSSNNAKRMVRNNCVFLLLSHFTHLFLIKLLFWGERLICDYISAHRHIFAPSPPPPASVDLNRAATQKEW